LCIKAIVLFGNDDVESPIMCLPLAHYVKDARFVALVHVLMSILVLVAELIEVCSEVQRVSADENLDRKIKAIEESSERSNDALFFLSWLDLEIEWFNTAVLHNYSKALAA
jgi:hypothetical protein